MLKVRQRMSLMVSPIAAFKHAREGELKCSVKDACPQGVFTVSCLVYVNRKQKGTVCFSVEFSGAL